MFGFKDSRDEDILNLKERLRSAYQQVDWWKHQWDHQHKAPCQSCKDRAAAEKKYAEEKAFEDLVRAVVRSELAMKRQAR